MKRIVILGGGFAGIYTTKSVLKELQRHSLDAKVILISDHNYFLFTPMLHEVATGGISRDNLIQPIRRILSGDNFSFVKEKAENIDTKKKIVYGKEFTQPYDILILGTGSQINFFNIKGAQENTIPLRTLYDAFRIRDRIINQIEKAENIRDEIARRKALTFMVIGGGPTGVEFAGELAEFIKTILKKRKNTVKQKDIAIQLIHRGKEILNMLPPYYGKKCRERLEQLGVQICLECDVTEVGKDYIVDGKKTKVEAGTIFWTAGFRSKTVNLDGKEVSSYTVEKTLQVKNVTDAFALGDCCSLEDNGVKVPMLAQVAVNQSKVITHNVLYLLGVKPTMQEYRHKLTGFLVSVGQYFAVAGIKNIYFSGFLAWWLWRTIYLGKLIGFGNKIRVAVDWTLNFFYPRDTSEIE